MMILKIFELLEKITSKFHRVKVAECSMTKMAYKLFISIVYVVKGRGMVFKRPQPSWLRVKAALKISFVINTHNSPVTHPTQGWKKITTPDFYM